MNMERVDHYYNNKNRNRYYGKGRSYDKNRSYNINNKKFRGRKTLEMIIAEVNIIEVIEEILRIETGHMTEAEVGIEIIEEGLVRIEETVYLGIGVYPPPGIKVKREGVITAGNQGIL